VTTETTTTAPNGTETVDRNPIPTRKMIPGATAGFGLQFVDEFGIHVVPEFRYTRWFGKSFDTLAGRTRPNSLEFVISLTF
jgi:hypothetical protein